MASDINDATGLPHSVSLGDVLADIKLAPAQVSAFLHNLAYGHLGGPNDDLGRALIEHANNITNPETYGVESSSGPDNPQARWANPTPGAQQGQATLPATGGSNEPSWMADARAAGWTPTDRDSAKIAAPGQPQYTGEVQPADVSPGPQTFESAPPATPPTTAPPPATPPTTAL